MVTFQGICWQSTVRTPCFTVVDMGSISDGGTKSLQVVQLKKGLKLIQNIEKRFPISLF